MQEAPAISPVADFLVIVSDANFWKMGFLKKVWTAVRFSLSSSVSRKIGSGSRFLYSINIKQLVSCVFLQVCVNVQPLTFF